MFTLCSTIAEAWISNECVMADQIVITEKTSQAKDVRAAIGSRYGIVLPAEGHLFELLEPEDVVPEWTRWSPVLLRPQGLYGTQPAKGGNKRSNSKPFVRRCAQPSGSGLPPIATEKGNSSAKRYSNITSIEVRSCVFCLQPRTLRLFANPSIRPNPIQNTPGSTPPPSRVARPIRFTICHSPAPRPSSLATQAVAQFEREMMLERQREGIAKAKVEGKYRGRKPTARLKATDIRDMLSKGLGKREVARRLGISERSVYRALSS